MENDLTKLIITLKQQAELFLLDANEFYPFGTYINMQNKIVPVGAYSESENPPSSELIELLEISFNEKIRIGECKIAAIAIDVVEKKNNSTYNAIEVRLYRSEREVDKLYFRYEVSENSVEFSESY